MTNYHFLIYLCHLKNEESFVNIEFTKFFPLYCGLYCYKCMLQKKEKDKATGIVKIDKETEEILRLGMHFGHSHSRKHPKIDSFLYGTRNGIDIIDPIEIKVSLEKTLSYLSDNKKSLILFVATKTPARELVKNLAEKLNMPYVVDRWLGGTLTNFDIVKKRIEHLKNLEEKKKRGDFEKYTKKEKARIEQEIDRIKRKVGGLKNLDRIPDILFVVDVKKEIAAIKEAKQKNISIVGICDTDGNPHSVDYSIIANDEAVSSLEYILNKVEKSLTN